MQFLVQPWRRKKKQKTKTKNATVYYQMYPYVFGHFANM